MQLSSFGFALGCATLVAASPLQERGLVTCPKPAPTFKPNDILQLSQGQAWSVLPVGSNCIADNQAAKDQLSASLEEATKHPCDQAVPNPYFGGDLIRLDVTGVALTYLDLINIFIAATTLLSDNDGTKACIEGSLAEPISGATRHGHFKLGRT